MRGVWLSAHGNVYDVTMFMERHPAGSKPILRKAGTDCTVDFDFHSEFAKSRVWPRFLVGRLVPCDKKYPSMLDGNQHSQSFCTLM